jgi:16S rRNA G966 N2-methylase RsmD
MIHNAEFVAWAKEEAARIGRGEAERFHACFCDPPYGLEFMGKEWDAPLGRAVCGHRVGDDWSSPSGLG